MPSGTVQVSKSSGSTSGGTAGTTGTFNIGGSPVGMDLASFILPQLPLVLQDMMRQQFAKGKVGEESGGKKETNEDRTFLTDPEKNLGGSLDALKVLFSGILTQGQERQRASQERQDLLSQMINRLFFSGSAG